MAQIDGPQTLTEAVFRLKVEIHELAHIIWETWRASWYLGWYVRLIDRIRS